MQSSETGRLILVRHGESEGNRDRRFTLTPHVPLTDLGREQARSTGARIARDFRPARVVASPFLRAQQTAELIAAALGLGVETEPALHERDFGVYVGKPYESVLADPTFDPNRRWEWRPENGESLQEVYNRVVPATERIARDNPGSDVVVVSHGGVMLALTAFFAGTWEGAAVAQNCGIIVVAHTGGSYGPPLGFD